MKDVERVNALNKMLLNANVVAYGAMVDLIKRTGRLDLDMSSVGHIDDFPAEIRIFTDNGLICLSITSVYLSGEDKARMEGMNQGVWLSVQELAHDGRWTQAAEELVSSCGLTEDECRKLQEESESFNDEMIKFIDNMFGRENMISEGSTISENDTICINIKYHKIGEVFNYKVGMSEMTLRVDKCDRCSGCAFENYIYDCVKSGCLGCEREDGESVRYTIVNT